AYVEHLRIGQDESVVGNHGGRGAALHAISAFFFRDLEIEAYQLPAVVAAHPGVLPSGTVAEEKSAGVHREGPVRHQTTSGEGREWARFEASARPCQQFTSAHLSDFEKQRIQHCESSHAAAALGALDRLAAGVVRHL